MDPTSAYPAGLDFFEATPVELDGPDPTHQEMHEKAQNAIVNMQTEFGTNPSGSATTVASRFTAVEARATTLESRVGARYTRAANQSFAATSVAAVSWDTENADAGGWGAVPGTTVTVPATGAGMVSISARVIGASQWPSGSYIQIEIDSAVWASGSAADGQTNAMTATCVPALSAGAVITVNVRNGGGAAINATAQLTLAKVSP